MVAGSAGGELGDGRGVAAEDLAKATGQATDLEPDVAARLLTQIEPILPDDMRGPDGEAAFGPRVEIASSAPAADRLAAFEGRHP